MEAKDTVMTLQQLHEKPKEQSYLEAQAEISFKAGIREVVEWMSKHWALVIFPDNKFYDLWQAKLKEWRL